MLHSYCLRCIINAVLGCIFFMSMSGLTKASGQIDIVDSFFKENICYFQNKGFPFLNKKKVVTEFRYSNTDQYIVHYQNEIWRDFFKIYSNEVVKRDTDIDSLQIITAYNCIEKKLKPFLPFLYKKATLNIVRMPQYQYNEYTYTMYYIDYENFNMSIMFKSKMNSIVRICYITGMS